MIVLGLFFDGATFALEHVTRYRPGGSKSKLGASTVLVSNPRSISSLPLPPLSSSFQFVIVCLCSCVARAYLARSAGPDTLRRAVIIQ